MRENACGEAFASLYFSYLRNEKRFFYFKTRQDVVLFTYNKNIDTQPTDFSHLQHQEVPSKKNHPIAYIFHTPTSSIKKGLEDKEIPYYEYLEDFSKDKLKNKKIKFKVPRLVLVTKKHVQSLFNHILNTFIMTNQYFELISSH